MKIKLNPDAFGYEEHEGCQCEWVLSDEKVENLYHTFEPTEELPINRDGSGGLSFLHYRFFSDEEFNDHLKNGDITVVEKNKIKYNKINHKL